MLRPSVPTRRVVGVAVAVTVGAGIGFGAYSLGSAAGANSSYLPGVSTAAGTGSDPGASTAEYLTLDEATAIAVEFAPGRVVEVDEDHEPTGLQYDVTVLHDNGTATKVEVDALTGQIVSTSFDDDWDS
jgi:uncharacterized membrane protein YkoI